MARRQFLLGLVITGLSVTCRPAQPELTEAERSAIAETVRAVTDELIAAGEQVDANRVFAYFSNAAAATIVDEGTLYESLDSILPVYRRLYAGFRAQDIRLGKNELHVLGRDLVLLSAEGESVVTDTAGMTSRIPFGWTLLWSRQGNEWRVLHAHQSLRSK